MDELERERVVALLARIGAEMEDASALAIGAAALGGEELSSVLSSISNIQSMAEDLMPSC